MIETDYGKTITLKCEGISNPKASISWYKNSEKIQFDLEKNMKLNDSGINIFLFNFIYYLISNLTDNNIVKVGKTCVLYLKHYATENSLSIPQTQFILLFTFKCLIIKNIKEIIKIFKEFMHRLVDLTYFLPKITLDL